MNIADINTRKAIVHAVNKGPIVDSELGGIEQPASQLFSVNAPYCDIDLTPKFNYDIEKATLFSGCGEPSASPVASPVFPEEDDEDDEVVSEVSATTNKETRTEESYVLFAVAGVVALILLLIIIYMMQRERAGQPVFTPLINMDEGGSSSKVAPAGQAP